MRILSAHACEQLNKVRQYLDFKNTIIIFEGFRQAKTESNARGDLAAGRYKYNTVSTDIIDIWKTIFASSFRRVLSERCLE